MISALLKLHEKIKIGNKLRGQKKGLEKFIYYYINITKSVCYESVKLKRALAFYWHLCCFPRCHIFKSEYSLIMLVPSYER